jgi:hypothetical protein
MARRMGINVNDKSQPYTDQILSGLKTVETRKTRSLDPYVGRRVGIVRTGKGRATLVGYATIGEPVFYATRARFDADYARHAVDSGSPHYFSAGGKFGYPLLSVKATRPRKVFSRGIVARAI